MTTAAEHHPRPRPPAAHAHAIEAGDRRLARIGFDLHDGPLQHIAVLAADLRLLRAQASSAPVAVLQGRIDDALALLKSLQTDVRELAHSLEPTTLLHRPFAELVRAEIDQAEADGIALTTRLSGDLDTCTASQRIALFRIVQEALWNVRHHSGARRASVVVAAEPTVLLAEVADHGRGFEVERAEHEAARTGRMGLAGMSERARLLGGRLEVTSRPGGPTTVRATIPRWRPSTGG